VGNQIKVDILGFQPELIPDILSGKKTNTWRIWSEKYVLPGDEVSLVNLQTNKPFARVQILEKCEKRFADLTHEDKANHEKFTSDDQMYKYYSNYYKMPVDQDTEVTIIKFNLL